MYVVQCSYLSASIFSSGFKEHFVTLPTSCYKGQVHQYVQPAKYERRQFSYKLVYNQRRVFACHVGSCNQARKTQTWNKDICILILGIEANLTGRFNRMYATPYYHSFSCIEYKSILSLIQSMIIGFITYLFNEKS